MCGGLYGRLPRATALGPPHILPAPTPGNLPLLWAEHRGCAQSWGVHTLKPFKV